MEISPQYSYKKVEKRIYSLWLKSRKFQPADIKRKKKKFVVMMAPPNITGSLHLGHFLENSLVDVLVRKKRMEGYQTLWLPGTDHAGIATQYVVEKELKKEGLDRWQLGREKFLQKIWEWKKKYGGVILEQFKKIGLSCDWSKLRFTLDKNYSQAVLQAFLHYYQKGWIYRAQRVINWCPRCQTSLSDLELEYQEEKTKLYYLKYPLKNRNNYIVVATTRPETMLGDSAIAVHPDDPRYKNFIGQTVILPLKNREIPIIADFLVDKNFGTGAVKVTPAHDLIDEEIAHRHQLPFYQVINQLGRMNKEAGEEFEGLTTQEARKKILEILKNQGLIEKEEDYSHNLALCYRCHTPIEPQPSWQWFLSMKNLAKLAEKAVRKGEIKILPKKWRKPYFSWLKNIKDWCISRQIWWGHRLPVWFCQNFSEKFLVSLKKPKKCPFCKTCQMKQSEDVLDTWFSSALWPFASLGWPRKTKELKIYYPTDFITSARDILHLWITRMIFSGLELTKKEPFKIVYIHPTVLTKEGKRMSKSLGTGIDPLELIENYGADASRFGILWQLRSSQDIRFSEEHCLAGKKFANKIWNATRFLLLLPERYPSLKKNCQAIFQAKNSSDKIIFRRLKKTIKKVNQEIEKFHFGQALEILYHFFWHEFCDKYIEISKIRIQNPKLQKTTYQNLLYILSTLLKLLHPFLPFITEEIYQKLPIKKKDFLITEKWPL